MASRSRLRTLGKVGGVAVVTAPYVRRVATDEALRDDVAAFIRSANTLKDHVRSDERLRDDARRLLESAQSGAGHIRGDIRPRHLVRNAVIGTGLVVASIGAGIAVAWPRTRRQITHAAGQGASRANAAARDIRERMAGQSIEARAA